MSWATNNYMASSGIPLKSGQSHTANNTWITKTELTTKYVVNTSLLSGYGANDWIETSSIAAGDPPTSTLTITYVSGQWIGTLSNPIASTYVDISYGIVDGWAGTCSGGSDESADMWLDAGKITTNGFSIATNTYTQSYSGYEALTSFSTNYRIQNSILINGVTRSNGAVFTIGGTTVTLVLTVACTPYSA